MTKTLLLTLKTARYKRDDTRNRNTSYSIQFGVQGRALVLAWLPKPSMLFVVEKIPRQITVYVAFIAIRAVW